MKKAYPVVMSQGEKFIIVFISDFNINTQGKDIPDAIEMARDAIGLMGIDMIDDGEALPEASDLTDVKAAFPSDNIISLADVDFDEYRIKHVMKVKINANNCFVSVYFNFFGFICCQRKKYVLKNPGVFRRV